MSDFHNTSLNAHEYWEMQADRADALYCFAIAELNADTCWKHDGFINFHQDVCNAAQSIMSTPYGAVDYSSAWEDGTPLEAILEAYQDGDTAAETAEALLQGEAEQAVEEIISDGGIF